MDIMEAWRGIQFIRAAGFREYISNNYIQINESIPIPP